MDFSQLSQVLLTSVCTIIAAVASAAVVYLKSYISRKIENDELKNSLLATTEVLQNSVNSSIANLSASSKIALADGKINKGELEDIREKALKHFSTQVSPALQKRLEAHVEDTQGFIVNRINSQIEKANTVTGVR